MPTSTPHTSKVHNPFTSWLLLFKKPALNPKCVSKPLYQHCFKQSLCACVGVQQQTWRAWILVLALFLGVLGPGHFFLVLNFTEDNCVMKNKRVSFNIQVWKRKRGWGSHWYWFLKCMYLHPFWSSFPHFTHSCSSSSQKMPLTHEFFFYFVKLVTFWHFTFSYILKANEAVISVN